MICNDCLHVELSEPGRKMAGLMMEVRNAHQRHYTSRVLPGVGICIVVSTFYLIMFSNHAN